MKVNLPIPPSANNLFGNRPGGRYPMKHYLEWQEEAGWALKTAKVKFDNKVPYRFSVLVPRDMIGDVDGRIKAPLDLLVKHEIVADDRFCISVFAERSAFVEPDRCLVSVEEA